MTEIRRNRWVKGEEKVLHKQRIVEEAPYFAKRTEYHHAEEQPDGTWLINTTTYTIPNEKGARALRKKEKQSRNQIGDES